MVLVKRLRINPGDTASLFSILLFWWVYKLLRDGKKNSFKMDDLYRPMEIDSSKLLGDRLEIKWKIEESRLKPSLLRCIALTFWKEISLLGCLYVGKQLGAVIQITFLGKLLLYFRKDTDLTKNEGLCYAFGLIVLSGFNLMMTHRTIFYGYQVGMKIRIAVCSLIYRKLLQFSHRSLIETPSGKLINLLSSDVMGFDTVAGLMHAIWFAPILFVVVCVLLVREAGWAGMIGMGIIFIVAPIQSVIAKLVLKYTLETASQTDKRNQLMAEIINGINIIKLYTWEKPISRLIQQIRRLELIKQNSYIGALYMTFSVCTVRMALFGTMLTLVLTNQDITASQIFVILAYYELASTQMAEMLVRCVTEVGEVLGSIKRINTFLESSTLESKVPTIHSNETVNREKKKLLPFEIEESSSYAVSITNGHAAWNAEQLQLTDINLNLKKGNLIGIVGPVGCGKSTLLNVLLKELPLCLGTMSVQGTIAYVNQEPWIFCGTIKENILFNQSYDELRYNKVLEVCALSKDLLDLPKHDETPIGEQGVLLSGGQKARISLARAAYFKADIYLFDDPFSAIDGNTGRKIFDSLIGPDGFLTENESTRILVTHQIDYLNGVDWIIGLKEGKIEFQDTPSQLAEHEIDFDKLGYQEYSADENDLSINNLKSTTRPISPTPPDDNIQDLEDEAKTKSFTYYAAKYFLSGSHSIYFFLIFVLFLISQVSASFVDWLAAFCVAQDEKYNSTAHNITVPEDTFTDPSTNSCVLIHGVVVMCLFIIIFLRSIGFFGVCVRSSQKLHDGMFNGLIYTEMRFFDVNPSGRILNRFSKDLGLVDDALPKAMLDATQLLLMIFGSFAITIYANYFNVIPLLLLILVLLYIRDLYLTTSKRIRELEGKTRSPVFTLISESIIGLTTIRSFGVENWFMNSFDSHQDLHTSTSFLMSTLSSAFGFYLDCLCWLFTAFIILCFFILKTNTLGHLVGLTITQALRVTGLMQWGVRQSAEMENHMMSVKRLLEYRDLKPEKNRNVISALPTDWASSGKISFRNVNFRYYEGGPTLLKNINLEILSKEKIGVVGRSGCGKSALIGAIMRLALVDGTIFIDDTDTSKVSLEQLRSCISIIPQDPVLFSGPLRHNLDPFDEYSDADLWKALDEVELTTINESLGLESNIEVGGTNLSVGEKQLICLARTILRKNAILILDEATANVDSKTDLLIQTTIQKKFVNFTVITIAHRLHTILNSDRVAVISDGEIIELSSPHELLEIGDGVFNEMVEVMGSEQSDSFRQTAKENFLNKKKN